jgi:hypothetical protein
MPVSSSGTGRCSALEEISEFAREDYISFIVSKASLGSSLILILASLRTRKKNWLSCRERA